MNIVTFFAEEKSNKIHVKEGYAHFCILQILAFCFKNLYTIFEHKKMPVSQFQIYHHNEDFALESGESLPGIDIAYHTYGNFRGDKSKVIWVCHAFTANSDVFDWWKGLFGEDCLYNPDDYFIVCANKIGSCYGSTGPLSINPLTGEPWYHSFPEISIRDMVNAHELLRGHLGIEKIHTVIGGSTGGHQSIEWSIMQPELQEHLVCIANHAKASPWSIAFSQSQRLAIEADQSWKESRPDAGARGLIAARSIALLSYRNYQTYLATQSEDCNEKITGFKAMSYQNYQGEKLIKRFNAYSYMRLLNALDSHNIGRGRESIEKTLGQIQAKTLVVGITSDYLFPVSEQLFLTEHIPGATFSALESIYGHDGFLIETGQLAAAITRFYRR
jgi:homoserine O-acetyltransferase/O-succinyltransferase